MKKSLIILSGGMDSVTLLYDRKDEIAVAVTFDYGSNHNKREEEFAKYHCEKLGIEHIIIPLTFIHDYFKSSLLEGASAITDGHYEDETINQRSYHSETASCYLLPVVLLRAVNLKRYSLQIISETMPSIPIVVRASLMQCLRL